MAAKPSPKIKRKGSKGNFNVFRVVTAPTENDPIFTEVDREGLTPRGNALLNSAFGRNSVWTAADLKGAFEFASEKDTGAMGKHQRGTEFFRIYKGKLNNQEFYRPTPDSNFADIHQNAYNQFQAVTDTEGNPAPVNPEKSRDAFIRHLLLTSNYAKSTQPQKSKEIIVKGNITEDVSQVFPKKGSISFKDFRDTEEHPRFTRVEGKVIPYKKWLDVKNSERPTRERPTEDFLKEHRLVNGETPLYRAVKKEITDSVMPTTALRNAFRELEKTQRDAFTPVSGEDFARPPLPPLPPDAQAARPPLPPLPPDAQAGGK